MIIYVVNNFVFYSCFLRLPNGNIIKTTAFVVKLGLCAKKCEPNIAFGIRFECS